MEEKAEERERERGMMRDWGKVYKEIELWVRKLCRGGDDLIIIQVV